MPSTYQSPFATSFKTAVNRGTPCSVAVHNIAKRTGKSTKVVFESLYKAGLCFRQKVNGQWIYWPCNAMPGNATNWKVCQVNMWQCFVDWCVCCGVCTPEQLWQHCGSQNDFMNFCKKFWNKQFSGTFTPATNRRTNTSTSTTTRKARTTGSTTRGGRKSYTFSGSRWHKAA